MKEKKIVIILGSVRDEEYLKKEFELLEEFNIPYHKEIISAHRDPERLRRFCIKIKKEKIEVVIAACGLSSALPGFVASYVDIPVVGVPLDTGVLKGIESLLSIVEVPRGIGLVSTGLGRKGFINAVIFALKILSLKDEKYKDLLKRIKLRFKK